MSLHAEPLRGGSITSDWARELQRTLRRQRVTAGHGLRQTETPGGTIISLAPQHTPPRAAAAPAAGFPWGDKWMWGIELIPVSENAQTFRLWNSAVRVDGTILQSLLISGPVGSSAFYYGELENCPTSGSWGVALDLDWSTDNSGRLAGDPWYAAELVLVVPPNGESELLLQESVEPDEDRTPERIPIAWFNGKELLRYWAPGTVYTPPIWRLPL